MRLQLTRPLVFFALETTGVNVSRDRIVEISMVRLLPDGSRESATYRVRPTLLGDDGMPVLRDGQEVQMHIPEQSSAVHHILDEDVRECRTFTQLAPVVVDYIRGCDLAGYNSNHFDVPLLQEEILRAGLDYDIKANSRMVDAFVIFQKHTPRTLTAAYMHYCGKDLANAHSANADTEATYEVLMAQLDKHADVPDNIPELEQYTTLQPTADPAGRILLNEKGDMLFNFGKYKGQPLRQVFASDSGYYSWLISGDFPLYTKRLFRRVMEDLKHEHRQQRRERDKAPATADQLQQLKEKFGRGAQLSMF